jgi:hypothetical protein
MEAALPAGHIPQGSGADSQAVKEHMRERYRDAIIIL